MPYCPGLCRIHRLQARSRYRFPLGRMEDEARPRSCHSLRGALRFPDLDSRSVLLTIYLYLQADILLLDEPTNHLVCLNPPSSASSALPFLTQIVFLTGCRKSLLTWAFKSPQADPHVNSSTSLGSKTTFAASRPVPRSSFPVS